MHRPQVPMLLFANFGANSAISSETIIAVPRRKINSSYGVLDNMWHHYILECLNNVHLRNVGIWMAHAELTLVQPRTTLAVPEAFLLAFKATTSVKGQ